MQEIIVYGWEEQNEAAWGIQKRSMPKEYVESINDDGSVNIINSDGCWFLKFCVAKKAVVEYWKNKKKIANLAITEINKMKKSDL